jgi:hypothetical protein
MITHPLTTQHVGHRITSFPPDGNSVPTVTIKEYPTGGRRAGLWVPNWSSTSCDLGVFVYQPAEQIATSKVQLGSRCRWW